MDSPYYTDPKVKLEIDEAMHQAVMLFQNLGMSCSKETVAEAKQKELDIFKSVHHLDPKFIDRLIR